MVACVLLSLPWDRCGRHAAGSELDGPRRTAAAEGVPAGRAQRLSRRGDAGLEQAARRQADHPAVLLRPGTHGQSAAARTAGRSRTEPWSMGAAARLAEEVTAVMKNLPGLLACASLLSLAASS